MIDGAQTFDEADRRELLAAISLCRMAMVRAATRAPIRSKLYRDVQAAIDCFDDLTETLTGRRDHLWYKAPSV